MFHDPRHRAVHPVDPGTDLAQGVEKHQPLGPRAVEHGPRRMEPADGKADEDRACGGNLGQEPLQIRHDHLVGQRQRRIEGRIGLPAEIPAQRAEAVRAQRRGDRRLPGIGAACQRVDEDEGRRAVARGRVVVVEERVGLGQGQVHGGLRQGIRGNARRAPVRLQEAVRRGDRERQVLCRMTGHLGLSQSRFVVNTARGRDGHP